MCPVKALTEYLRRTEMQCGVTNLVRPVVTPLNYPISGLLSAAISNILNKAIRLAGLAGLGYTMKLFHPTGVTVAVEMGVKPELVQSTGRWKNQECFMKHYVHAKPGLETSDLILMS